MSLITNSFQKIALVTGANRGLGFEVALDLARKNFQVIMADKVNQTRSKEQIIKETGNEAVYATHLDLGRLSSIRVFTDEMYKNITHLDVLVNNAGVFCMKKQQTVDCFDAVMQINHLGPFLLTHLLTDLIKRSKNGRIVFITSHGSFFHRLTVEQISKPNYFVPHFISGLIHYYNTKLCNMISSKYFAENLKKYNIICNSVHPSMMNTEFLTSGSDKSLLAKLEHNLSKAVIPYVTKDVKNCADGVVFLAASDQVKNVSGKYFSNYQVHREPSIIEDKEFCNAICDESKNLLGLKAEKL